jgi:hypothetical protein
MVDVAQAIQRLETTAFCLRVTRAEEGFEYQVADRAPDVSDPEIAEVLFSAALDMHARESLKVR